MPVETNAELEFSRPLALDDIKPSGTVVKLTATDDERQRLARRFDLPDVARMVAEFRVTRGASGIPIRVIGRVAARELRAHPEVADDGGVALDEGSAGR